MTPRIAFLYGDLETVGRNDGGPLYAWHNAAKILGKENAVHVFPKYEINGKFDLYWLTDFGEDALGMQDFEVPHPSVYWTSDTHLGYDYRLSRAKRCDWVFCAQRKAVEDFIRDGVPADKCFWLPHAFDPLAYGPGVFNKEKNAWDKQAVPLKKYDVCFVGNLNDANRVQHLDKLFKEFPNFYWCTRRFHEAAEIFNQSKIVFNVSARKELNMRHFEALGTGSFLLTDNIPEDQNVFKEGVHFVGYDDFDNMVAKAKHYLADDAARDRIAAAGHAEAMDKHTYMHRVLSVLQTVGIPFDANKAEAMLAWREASCV